MSSVMLSLWADLTAAIRRAFYRWCLNRTTAQLAAARERLDESEADLGRQLPPEILVDIQEDVVNRRMWVAMLLDERAYLESKLAEQSV